MFQDKIMKDSWVYQEIVQESEERGRKEGEARGEEKGAQALRQAVVQFVVQHFPTLETMAAQQTARMVDVNALNVLLVSLFTAQEIEVARQLLQNAVRD